MIRSRWWNSSICLPKQPTLADVCSTCSAQWEHWALCWARGLLEGPCTKEVSKFLSQVREVFVGIIHNVSWTKVVISVRSVLAAESSNLNPDPAGSRKGCLSVWSNLLGKVMEHNGIDTILVSGFRETWVGIPTWGFYVMSVWMFMLVLFVLGVSCWDAIWHAAIARAFWTVDHEQTELFNFCFTSEESFPGFQVPSCPLFPFS